ncbi:uncharacterized protein GLRG_08643 [Colletotrichum graminicola M1.001]|uniref:2EXR domain-containing protein n=1 Tax=Colletotrichum graminicola (strain M1.001 / M2 / FGSC 10212) TaxID=645133 RepID=E3QR76_COLGM|nr:uncharacterized protein GLRG_08643 [Colletotrichum graminicola M1.001]EFQ33364.1 hypothetical protein GLRG_08643 [Colletotrichum graminicola M1.001]
MDTEPVAGTTTTTTTTTTTIVGAAPPDDDDDDEEEEETRPGGARTTSAPRFWIDFSLFDDGLDAAATAAAATADTLPRFHRFPDLPPEIRIKIWSYLVAPRVVAACCFERDHRLPARSVPAPCEPSSSSSPPTCPVAATAAAPMVFNPTCPVLLLVCRESRALGLAHYELAFSWRVSALAAAVARPPRAWFNFRLDALYLAGALDPRDRYGFDTPVVRFLRPRDARRVRRLACAFSALRYPERGPRPGLRLPVARRRPLPPRPPPRARRRAPRRGGHGPVPAADRRRCRRRQ